MRRQSVYPAAWLGAVILAGSASSASADTLANLDQDQDRWQFYVVPYLWLPNANGSLDTRVTGLPGPRGNELSDVDVSAEIGPNDYLDNLEMALMLSGEARKGPWSLFTDIIYVDFDSQDSRVRSVTGPLGYVTRDISTRAEMDLSSTIWTLGAGYTVAHGSSGNLDLFAGARYLSLDSDLTLTLQGERGRFDRRWTVSLDRDDWDGVIGAKGQILFPDTHWFLPYYLDVGTGSSNWTWQGLIGVGYRFDWGDVILAVRSLSYDFDDKDADLRFTGPALGVGFRW